ncbi:MAG: hemerythrin domain-containing protein [Microbacteriaceae bacterium]
MSATPLPSEGAVPVDGPKKCDASGMIEIHRMLLHSFQEAAVLVDAVAEGDNRHAARVGTQLQLISTALHAHHEGEDARLWNKLEARAPACALHVERMKQQHADMLIHLRSLDVSVPPWQLTASKAAAVPVLKSLHATAQALTEHFPDEEENIVPVIEQVIRRSEERWFGKHGRAATPKGQTWNMLGAILVAQPDGGTAWLKKNLPWPARLAWKFRGARRYRRYRAGIEAS